MPPRSKKLQVGAQGALKAAQSERISSKLGAQGTQSGRMSSVLGAQGTQNGWISRVREGGQYKLRGDLFCQPQSP